MDHVVSLSRIQFALTIMFHYLFPPLSIGLGVVLVYLDGQSLRTGDPLYEKAAKFWTKIFALVFGMGVATGIVMEFEFGTNWATYSRFVGDVFGSALAAEGIFAFFLESGFLAVLVFGWNRVGPRMHFFATCMVAFGSLFSSVWITIANSWQQTPAGHEIVPVMKDGQPWVIDGVPMMRAEIVDFWAMVWNPSTIHRITHVWIGCFMMGGLFVVSISAWYLLRGRHKEFAKRSFKGGLVLSTLAAMAAPISGHVQAKNVYRTQPAKMAAMEGHFKTGPGDLTLFGVPDDDDEVVHGKIAIPGGLSFLLFEDFDQPVIGLDKFRKEDRPKTFLPFLAYHLMVLVGTALLGLSLLGCFFWWRGTLFQKRWLLWLFVFSVLGAVVANQTGWVAAETGRQPWIVYPPVTFDDAGEAHFDETRGLRTTDGVSKAIEAEQVQGSILMFGAIYALLFVIWIRVMNDKIQKGPDPVPPSKHPDPDPDPDTDLHGFLDAASERVAHGAAEEASVDGQ